MFEYLYDYNSERRTQAVKYVVANFDHLHATASGNNLLKSALIERLDDDEPSVLIELFKMGPENLLKLVPVSELLTFCGKILSKCLEMPLIWKSVAAHVLSLIIQKEIILGNEQLIMLLIFPFMTPNIDDTKFKILDGKKSKYSINLGEKNENVSKKLTKVVQAIIGGSEYFPGNVDQTLAVFETFNIKSETYALHKAVYLLNGLKSDTDPEKGQQLLEIVKKCAQNIDTKEKRQALLLTAIDLISQNVQFNTMDNDLSLPGPSLTLKLSLLNILVLKFVTSDQTKDKEIVNVSFKKFLGVFCNTLEQKLEFLSLYFTADCLIQDGNEDEKRLITPQYEFYVMKMTASILKSQKQATSVSNKTFIRYLMALASPIPELRQAAFEVFVVLKNSGINADRAFWDILIQKMVERKEELVIDKEQLPLILFTVFGGGSGAKKALNACFAAITDFISTSNVENSSKNYEKAKALSVLKHIKDADIFEKTCHTGNAILDCSQQENLVVIGKYESLILKQIISRIDKDTVKLAMKHAQVWNFILSALKSDALLQLFDQKSVPVAQATLEMFDNEIYKSLGEKHRQEWFQTVIVTSTFAHNLLVHTAAGKMLKEMTVEAKIVLETLEKMKNSCEDQSLSSNKERRRSLNKSIVHPDTLQHTRWKQGITLLEFMQTKLQVSF